MSERKYDNLERMRKDIARDKKKAEALQEQIKEKEEKLKQAEGARVVADVVALQLSPEQVGAVLELVESGQIRLTMNGGAGIKAYATRMAGKKLNVEESESEEQTEDTQNEEKKEEDSEDE